MNEKMALAEIFAGNAAAYQFLVERYQTPVTRYLERLLGHRGQAEEVAQDAFIEAYYAVSKNRNGRVRQLAEQSLPMFFYSFATHRALHSSQPSFLQTIFPFLQKKHSARNSNQPSDEHALFAPPPHAPRARIGEPVQSQTHAERIEHERLQTALLRLPREQAACILLHSMVGFTYDEVATILRCSTAQVRSHMARGRQTLLAGAS